VPSVPSVVIVLERIGKAGRQCNIVMEYAGDFVLYERIFTDPADRANDEEGGQVTVSIDHRGRAARQGLSRSLAVMCKWWAPEKRDLTEPQATEGWQKDGGQKDRDCSGFIFLPKIFLP
jgi:hypothetical protein